jgi:hypothetical protein
LGVEQNTGRLGGLEYGGLSSSPSAVQDCYAICVSMYSSMGMNVGAILKFRKNSIFDREKSVLKSFE